LSKTPTTDIESIVKAVLSVLSAPEPGITCRIIKRNDEKRLVTVITNTVTTAEGEPIVDHDDDVIKIENLEEVFIKSFARGGAGMGDEMHDETDKVDVVQHFTLARDEWASLGEAMGVDLPPMPEVGIAKLYVKDDALWLAVKSGRYTEVSIAGDGMRSAL